jgi:hypothetical protein
VPAARQQACCPVALLGLHSHPLLLPPLAEASPFSPAAKATAAAAARLAALQQERAAALQEPIMPASRQLSFEAAAAPVQRTPAGGQQALAGAQQALAAGAAPWSPGTASSSPSSAWRLDFIIPAGAPPTAATPGAAAAAGEAVAATGVFGLPCSLAPALAASVLELTDDTQAEAEERGDVLFRAQVSREADAALAEARARAAAAAAAAAGEEVQEGGVLPEAAAGAADEQQRGRQVEEETLGGSCSSSPASAVDPAAAEVVPGQQAVMGLLEGAAGAAAGCQLEEGQQVAALGNVVLPPLQHSAGARGHPTQLPAAAEAAALVTAALGAAGSAAAAPLPAGRVVLLADAARAGAPPRSRAAVVLGPLARGAATASAAGDYVPPQGGGKGKRRQRGRGVFAACFCGTPCKFD